MLKTESSRSSRRPNEIDPCGSNNSSLSKVRFHAKIRKAAKAETPRLRMKLLSILSLTSLLACVSLAAIKPQDDDNDPAKAAALVKSAVAARGGETYLKIHTVVSRGQFTPYEKGVSGDPVSFVDYVSYPGRERTEFDKGDNKFIQTNSEVSNWVYDAKQRMIKDQKEEQISQFRQSAR